MRRVWTPRRRERGSFSSGSEGCDFQDTYCRICVNNGDDVSDEGCAVWDVHTLYNYDQCKPGLVQIGDSHEVHGPTVSAMLGGLIRRERVGQRCLMFRPRPDLGQETAGQMTLLGQFDSRRGTSPG